MKELIGFFLVILSAFPMGIAEGRIIEMNEKYVLSKVAPMVLLYFIGFCLYLAGFMQIPSKIGFIIGVWEIAAVSIAVYVAVSKQNFKWDWEYTLLYGVIIGSTYILGLAAERIFIKAGI